MIDKDRALGTLLGGAVGDALGTTLEFSRPHHVLDNPFPVKMTGPHTDVTGGGPFRVAVGQVTDDTQMAVALACSILDNGKFIAWDVQKRYVEWSREAFDCGGQTRASLSAASTYGAEAGYRVWADRGRKAAGNGSLMRTWPLAIAHALDQEELIMASMVDSALTHADPICLMACAAYNCAIDHFLVHPAPRGSVTGSPAAAVAIAGSALQRARHMIPSIFPGWYHPSEIGDAADSLYEDLDLATEDDPLLMSTTERQGTDREVGLWSTPGYVRTAFRYAFWALYHAQDYQEALVDVVNRGGDSDTNGAIAGALLGAYFGASGIPKSWKDKVMAACQDTPTSPWYEVYHPRLVLSLVNWVANTLNMV